MRNEGGVAGFFEDIQVLIVVTISMGIFLASAVNAYASYLSFQDSIRFQKDANDFADSLLSYDGLIHEKRRGMLDAFKLGNLDPQKIRQDLQINYEFQIIVNDVSKYPNASNYDIIIESSSPLGSRRSSVLSANIWISDIEIHAARLAVTIWRL